MDYSQTGDVFLCTFAVEGSLNSRKIYEMKLVFGFFPAESLAEQKGLSAEAGGPAPVETTVRTSEDACATSIDVAQASSLVRTGLGPIGAVDLRLANGNLLMLDRVVYNDPNGGRCGHGRLRGEKDVDESSWFFKAHFFQDPVQPGSLGLEGMLQLLQFHMLERGMAQGIPSPCFQPVALGNTWNWTYRGQVLPEHRRVTTDLEIVRIGTDEQGPFAFADGWLAVDGKTVYKATNLGMRIVPGSRTDRIQQTFRVKILPPLSCSIPKDFPVFFPTRVEQDRAIVDIQKFRGEVYVKDKAIPETALDADGRHRVETDVSSWHIMVCEGNGPACACVRMRIMAPTAKLADLDLHKVIARMNPENRVRYTDSVENVRRIAHDNKMQFAEVGGWAVANDYRETEAALISAVSVWSLARMLGGVVCIAGATTRHHSATMLQRLGAMPLDADVGEASPFFDEYYGCDMILLRGDPTRLAQRYEKLASDIITHLRESCQ
jgi:3-hydroxymyristoyl/3-hydroxydecanoyl-(acyl carrier protein) dehydratase